MMTDSTGRYRNSLHCAALLLKNEGNAEVILSEALIAWLTARMRPPLTPRRSLGFLQGLQHVLLAVMAAFDRVAPGV